MVSIQRDYFDRDHCLSHAIEGFGHVSCAVAQKDRILPHAHRNSIEIFYFVRGHVRWWVADQSHDLSGNHFLIHQPGVLHGSEERILQPCEYYWFQLHVPSLRRSQDKKWTALLERLRHLKAICFSGVFELGKLFQAISSELHKPDSLSPCSIETNLQQIIIHVLRSHENFLCSSSADKRSAPIRSSLDWVEAHLREATPERMHRAANMPAEHFRLIFFKEMGINPRAFIHFKKIEEAKRNLRMGMKVTAVAHDLGFSSSQHFATVFRKIVGLSPTEFLTKKPSVGSSIKVETQFEAR